MKGDLRAGVLFGVACASGYARTIPTRRGQWPAGNLLMQVCLREKYNGWIGYHEYVDLHSLTRNGTFSPSYAVYWLDRQNAYADVALTHHDSMAPFSS